MSFDGNIRIETMAEANPHSDSQETNELSVSESNEVKKPRVRNQQPQAKRHQIKKIRRSEDEIDIDELQKKIQEFNARLDKRVFLYDEDIDSPNSYSEKKLKKDQDLTGAKPVEKPLAKCNFVEKCEILHLKRTNAGDVKLFPCFPDKDVFKVSEKSKYSNMLHHHRYDNDDDTSSEDLAKGKQRALECLYAGIDKNKKIYGSYSKQASKKELSISQQTKEAKAVERPPTPSKPGSPFTEQATVKTTPTMSRSKSVEDK